MGDKVTVEQARRVRAWLAPQAGLNGPMSYAALALALLDEHSGDRECCTEDAPHLLDGAPSPLADGTHWIMATPSEPPRPELPPEREGWVLTGEWRPAKKDEWYWSPSAEKPLKGNTAEAVHIMLPVPDPPEEGWVVTKYEEPQKGDLIWSGGPVGLWLSALDGEYGRSASYPDGRRFIAEDRDDDRTRLAKALASERHTGWDALLDGQREGYLSHADRLLALGVKAPDPVRLESL